MRRGQDSLLHLIGQSLLADSNEITQEPLPRRWVDLIHHLNERERKRSGDPQTEPEPREGRSGQQSRV